MVYDIFINIILKQYLYIIYRILHYSLFGLLSMLLTQNDIVLSNIIFLYNSDIN